MVGIIMKTAHIITIGACVSVLIYLIMVQIDRENDAFGGPGESWREECVYGQLVYVTANGKKASAVNALTANGSPIPCGNINNRGYKNVTN